MREHTDDDASQLIQRIARGERQALTELYIRYQHLIVWGAPLLWFAAIGLCLVLLMRSRSTSGALLSGIWLMEIIFNDEGPDWFCTLPQVMKVDIRKPRLFSELSEHLTYMIEMQ